MAALGLLFAGLTGCSAQANLDPTYYHTQLYTCCNLFVQFTRRGEFLISDRNTTPGFLTIPVGTPVRLIKARGGRVEFTAGGEPMTLYHDAGEGREPLAALVGRTFVREDPRPRIAALPVSVRNALQAGMVKHGMNREQVIWAVGYPPPDRTPSIETAEWTYWHDESEYRVRFSPHGIVAEVLDDQGYSWPRDVRSFGTGPLK